jgi:GNAT superfamily N-acetyltransferase
MTVQYYPLSHNHFEAVISLGNLVHGENYLDQGSLKRLFEKGEKGGVNSSFVAIDTSHAKAVKQPNRMTAEGYLVGFRITCAPGQWCIDEWCTDHEWGIESKYVCYFKSNTVDESYRGQGIGSELLNQSIEVVKQQGGTAGLAHIWLASPGNSAYRYFRANGGKLIKKHKDKWLPLSLEEGYECPICGDRCRCEAAEMLLPF